MGIVSVLESEVAHVLPGEEPCIHCQMNRNTITLTPCNIPHTPHIIINDPSTEDSEVYIQFLQPHNIQFNNIMNPYKPIVYNLTTS